MVGGWLAQASSSHKPSWLMRMDHIGFVHAMGQEHLLPYLVIARCLRLCRSLSSRACTDAGCLGLALMEGQLQSGLQYLHQLILVPVHITDLQAEKACRGHQG